MRYLIALFLNAKAFSAHTKPVLYHTKNLFCKKNEKIFKNSEKKNLARIAGVIKTTMIFNGQSLVDLIWKMPLLDTDLFAVFDWLEFLGRARL